MARKPKDFNPSSISGDVAADFLDKAKERDTKWCENISGFHLIKLKTGGAWRYRYQDATGKRRTATIAKYKEMKPFEAANKALDWFKGDDVDPLADKASKRRTAQEEQRISEARTVRNYLEKEYLPQMDRWYSSQSSKTNYQRIKNHFADLLDRDMVTLDQQDIRAWQSRVEEKGRTHETIRRTFGALKTMLNAAVQDEVISENPLKRVKLRSPMPEEQARIDADPNKEKRRAFTRDEVKGILSGLELYAEELKEKRRNSRAHGKPHLFDLDSLTYPHWFIPFCHLAMNTGLRPGDLYSLTWDELNIRFGRLTKATEKSKGNLRKGKKPTIVDMGLNSTIKSIMENWHKEQGKPDSGLVFPSPVTGRKMDKQAHMKPWKRVKELGGLNKELNFYAFRHHFISSMIKQGMPLLTVAKLAGHKSLEMIQEHYGHLCEEQAIQALELIEQTYSVGDDSEVVAV